jgi:cell division transport system permease protein
MSARNRRRRPAASVRPQPGAASMPARAANWRDLHLYSLLSSLGRLSARPFASGLTVAVMAVALCLPLLMGLLVGNLQRLSGAIGQSQEIGAFLKPGTADAQARQALAAVRELPGVGSVELRSAEQGLEEFRQMAAFGDALALLEQNPIPAVLEVQPAQGADPGALVQALQALPQIDLVQHDAVWRQRLEAWLLLGRRLAWALSALLIVGALLVVGNTVRLDVQGRAEEISVIQLLGGTAGFVRRPFLYLGAWYGLLAGALALLLVWSLQAGLAGAVSALASSYESGFRLQGFSMLNGLAVLVGAAALGWLGAFLAVGHHLRQAQPGRRNDGDQTAA